MSQEILGKLQRVQQGAEGLYALMTSLRAHAPVRADGYDSTRQVRVSIGADGLPTAIRVENGWQDQLEPQAIGQAVLDAFTAAVAEAMRAWSETLEEASWQSRVDDLEGSQARHLHERDPGFPPSAATGSSGNRDPQEIAEDALRAAERLRTQLTTKPAVGVGADRSGNVSITLSQSGLRECQVRTARWASWQDGRSLTVALETALRAARSELDAQRALQPTPGSFNQLLGEALAALQRIAESAKKDEL